jgi:hypothetical protein
MPNPYTPMAFLPSAVEEILVFEKYGVIWSFGVSSFVFMAITREMHPILPRHYCGMLSFISLRIINY